MAGAASADPFGVRSGVRPGTSPTTVTVTSTTWTVGAHAGVVDLQPAVEASGYAYAVNATGGLPTGPVTAADLTRPRVDIVWVRNDDPSEGDASPNPTVVFGYTAGAPLAGSPVAPATPARCMVLATIQVPMSGGGSPTVIWVAPFAVAAGGILPVPAGVRPTTPYVGQHVDDPAFGLLRYNGTAWRGTKSVAIPAVGTAVVTTASTTSSLLATLVVPDQGCAGTLMVSSKVHYLSSPPDVFGVFMLCSGSEVGTDRNASKAGGNMANCSAQVAMVAGSATTVTLNIARYSGTGTATADASTAALGSIWALFVPA